MIFRQLLDLETSTWTYILGDPWSRDAVVVDPVLERADRDHAILEELGLRLVYTLDTHVHADHVTAAAALRARTGCRIVVSRASGATGADLYVDDGDAVRFGLQAIEVRSTPGHTNGCVTYVAATEPRAFTGDALLIRGCGRTDFQEGDARTLFRSVRDKLFSLPDDTAVYPAHDYQGRTCSTIREERLYNPRLGGGRTEDAFVALMADLKLAYPKRIDVAVPANRTCGQTDDVASPARWSGEGPPEPSPWPDTRSGGGALVAPAVWVADHLDELRLIDVRTLEEWEGPDGRIAGAELVPLADLPTAAATWDRASRIVLVCRSGGRSDRAARDLEQLGFRKVASLSGGMLRWAALGMPVAGGEQG